MCNLYTSARSREEVARLFHAQLPFDLPEVKSHTYPKGHGFIVRKLDGQRVVDCKPWGIPNRMPGKRPGNSETVGKSGRYHSYTPCSSLLFGEIISGAR